MRNKKFVFKLIILGLVFLFSFNFVRAEIDRDLSNRLKGHLLLQVEDRGQIWYVDADEGERYLVNLNNALEIFNDLAIKLEEKDFNTLYSRYQGYFVINESDLENLWYIDFQSRKHQVKQDTLMNLFGALPLGISNDDLEKIPLPSDENDPVDTIWIGNPETSVNALIEDPEFLSFWELWQVVKEKYVEGDIDESELFTGAKKGLVEGLGDDYSTFMTKEESEGFLNELSGQFEGIGAEVAIRNGNLTVVAPLPDMPAENSGVRAGDIITHIDGQGVEGMTLNQAVNLIRGEKGTLVVLSIIHKDGIKEDIYVMRNTITYHSLDYEIRDDNIAYIRMIRFNTDTAELFQKAVNEILEQGAKGIILDLRNNPGGYMNMAIDVASYWTGPEIIVMEKYRNEDNTKIHLGIRSANLNNIPTVALINAGSASASEIVAGALQDYSLATIVGEQSFGKGSVQEMAYLSDGSYVKITISKWYTPDGNSIDGEGITPDIEVKYTAQDYAQGIDPQLNQALELLK